MTLKDKPKERLLRARDVAERLGIHEGTVRIWVSQGRMPIPVVRLGRAVRFRDSDLTHLLEEKTVIVEKATK